MALDPHTDALENTLVTDREHWLNGPPHGLFTDLRRGCPVHWTSKITEYPGEAGFWSVTRADHVHEVSRDWQTYSSELGGVTALTDAIFPLELSRAMFIGMDPPKHDRLKALFQRGFTPKRIAEHEDEIRAIVVRVLDSLDGQRLEEHEIVMGFFLLVAAGNDSTKATYASGMRALLENPDQRQKLLDDPSLVPSAVEESLRMFPAFAHFRRTATHDVDLGGQQIREGEKEGVWYVSSNRDQARYNDPAAFAESPFLNQLKTLPVRRGA